MFSVGEIDRLLEEMDRQYQSDRKKLLDAREVLLRMRQVSAPTPTAQTLPTRPARTDSTRARRQISGRDVVRRAIAAVGGDFTLHDLKSAAADDRIPGADSLAPGVWTSTLNYLKEKGQIEMVHEASGNTPSTYRLVASIQDLLHPPKEAGGRAAPLQGIIKEAIESLPMITFNRRELYDHFVSLDPRRAERWDIDVIGTILNRLANREDGVRTLSRDNAGNTYEKIK